MKGYYISEGYMGLVGKRYILFVNEEEYKEYIQEYIFENADFSSNVS